MLYRYEVKERHAEGQMVVDLVKRMAKAWKHVLITYLILNHVVNTLFKKSKEHRVTYKCGQRCKQLSYAES